MTPDSLAAYDAVLFDIDGTLVDSNEFHVRAWAEAFRRHGFLIPPERIRREIGKGADQLIPSIIPGIRSQDADAVDAAHGQIFKSRFLLSVRPFADATELVARMHDAGLKIALASSAKREEVDHYIKLLEIEPLVDASTSADDVARSKPAADIFASALKKLALPPDARVLVIGDTPYDVIAATGCGLPTSAVLTGGFSESELRTAGAIEVHASVSALLEAIGPARPAIDTAPGTATE